MIRLLFLLVLFHLVELFKFLPTAATLTLIISWVPFIAIFQILNLFYRYYPTYFHSTNTALDCHLKSYQAMMRDYSVGSPTGISAELGKVKLSVKLCLHLESRSFISLHFSSLVLCWKITYWSTTDLNNQLIVSLYIYQISWCHKKSVV